MLRLWLFKIGRYSRFVAFDKVHMQPQAMCNLVARPGKFARGRGPKLEFKSFVMLGLPGVVAKTGLAHKN
jgi:hypothetical protein